MTPNTKMQQLLVQLTLTLKELDIKVEQHDSDEPEPLTYWRFTNAEEIKAKMIKIINDTL